MGPKNKEIRETDTYFKTKKKIKTKEEQTRKDNIMDDVSKKDEIYVSYYQSNGRLCVKKSQRGNTDLLPHRPLEVTVCVCVCVCMFFFFMQVLILWVIFNPQQMQKGVANKIHVKTVFSHTLVNIFEN